MTTMMTVVTTTVDSDLHRQTAVTQ